ncbi:MAG TPA: helix-turn-helix domain-containing protein, partial [Bradyrhizobium sp.]|nr:helix-turn-helix domain-containing protein [Bradyrhizobium sp.]
LARHMVALTMEAPRLEMHEATAIAMAVRELVATCLSLGSASSRRPPNPEKLSPGRQVRAYIEQNLQREALAPTAIMKDLGISRSQLYRQFERFGGIQHYIRHRRLRRCLFALCNPLQADQRIGDIAYGLGFTDAAYFSRIFRQAFGISPQEARMATRRVDTSILASFASAPPDTALFAHWVRELMIG